MKTIPTLPLCLVVLVFCGSLHGATIPQPNHEGHQHADTAEDTLRMVHLVFRHGERSPADTFPKDPYFNFTFPPYGWGQLTNEGRMSQFNQGKWLREKYGKLLGDEYMPKWVEAMTTDVDRTKMSMALMMAGLYPPKGDQVWNHDLLWQPVPSSHQILDQDKLLLVRSCPRYSEALKQYLEKPETVEMLKKYQPLYEYLTENTGAEVKTPEDVQDIYSSLKAEEQFKLKLPEWTKTVYPEQMSEVTALSFVMNVATPELQKIKGGPLLNKILQDSKLKMNGSNAKKLYAYAGHDSTISNLLMTLDVWDPQVPGYNIMIIAELHQLHPNDWGLKVMLRNTTSHEPWLLTVPGCTEVCPLDKLTELSKAKLPDNLKKACTPVDPNYSPEKDGGP